MPVLVDKRISGRGYVRLIRRTVLTALDHEGIPPSVEVSVVVCNDEAIRKLNREYLGHDAPTDVLSFPQHILPAPGAVAGGSAPEDDLPEDDLAEEFSGIESQEENAADDNPGGDYRAGVRRGLSEAIASASIPGGSERPILGDIVISLPAVMKQAEERSLSLEQEISLVTAHATLHLLGYDHDSEGTRAIMWQRQDEIVARVMKDAPQDLAV